MLSDSAVPEIENFVQTHGDGIQSFGHGVANANAISPKVGQRFGQGGFGIETGVDSATKAHRMPTPAGSEEPAPVNNSSSVAHRGAAKRYTSPDHGPARGRQR